MSYAFDARRRFAAALLICAPLGACGGGEGGGGTTAAIPTASTPTPTATPSPTPSTSTTAPVVYRTVDEISTDQMFGTLTGASVSAFLVNSSNAAIGLEAFNTSTQLLTDSPQVSMLYGKSSAMFGLSFPDGGRTYTAGELKTHTTTFDAYASSSLENRLTFGSFTDLDTPFVDFVTTTDAGPRQSLMDTLGRRVDGATTSVHYATYGSETLVSDMPQNGTDVYRVAVDAGVIDGATLKGASARGVLNVDYAAGRISGTVTLSFSGNTPLPQPLVATINCNIAPGTNRWSGTIVADNDLRGTIAGRFYGSVAADLGGSFSASGSAGSIAGIVIGQRGPNVSR